MEEGERRDGKSEREESSDAEDIGKMMNHASFQKGGGKDGETII